VFRGFNPERGTDVCVHAALTPNGVRFDADRTAVRIRIEKTGPTEEAGRGQSRGMLLPKRQQPTKPTQPVSIASEMRQFGDAEICGSVYRAPKARPDRYEIVKLLPVGRGEPEYRIKSPREEHERVVRESELKPADDGTAG
jgi:hypothetical protein